MGDWNPNAPTVIGSEVYPTNIRSIDLGANPLYGIAQRVNPGAILPTALHTYERANKNSLHACELVDTLVPVVATETIFPGTNTGAIGTGWQTETLSASPDFTRVNKQTDDTRYMAYNGLPPGTGAVPVAIGYHSSINMGAMNSLGFRGNRSTKYLASNLRVVSVTLTARVASASNVIKFQLGLSCNGETDELRLVVSPAFSPKNDSIYRNYSLTLPGDPWAMSSVNAGLPYWQAPNYSKTWDDRVTTAGPYNFGIIPLDTTGQGGGNTIFRCSGLWLTIAYAAENRRCASYPQTPLLAGWNKQAALSPTQRVITFTSNSGTTALTTPAAGTNGAADFTVNDVGSKIVRASDGQVVGTISSVTNKTTAVLAANGASTNTSVTGYLGTPPTALSASTYYWLVHGQVAWAPASTVAMDVLSDPSLVATTTATQTGEHRTCYDLAFTNAGSLVAATAKQTTGELLPTLIDTGSIASQSQPYTTLSLTGAGEIHQGQSIGQQITTAAATAYDGVTVSLIRGNPKTYPAQPLTVEIRHGAGALTGGGTLDATATIQPSAFTAVDSKHKVVSLSRVITAAKFAVPFTSILNQQYVVYLKSAAKQGAGWSVPLLDTASNQLASGTTLAAVEGASIGGQTDGFDQTSGSVTTRYDAAMALSVAPTAPVGVTTTVIGAA